MNRKFEFCTDCGRSMGAGDWPMTCKGCGATHYLNPLPVAALIIKTADGVLTVRRSLMPGKGKIAFPGGFVAVGESWQQAAAREVLEETGIVVLAHEISLFDAVSAPDGTLLIFGEVERLVDVAVDEFVPNAEVAALVLVHEPVQLAFPIHTLVLGDWFEKRCLAHL